MTETLAMFPLELVVFPEEKLALHIFEDRYQQLIADCETDVITFGIPAYINKKMAFGTEVKLDRVAKRYPSGASDIICKGLRIFKIESFFNKLDDRLYAGASISYLPNLDDGTRHQRRRFIALVKELYATLDVVLPSFKPELISSYSFAHKIGLALEQELKLIQMEAESERFAFLIDHLSVTIPVIKQVNKTKELIKLNGHFKNFDPLDFTDFKLEDF